MTVPEGLVWGAAATASITVVLIFQLGLTLWHEDRAAIPWLTTVTGPQGARRLWASIREACLGLVNFIKGSDTKENAAAMEVALMAMSTSLQAGRSLPQALEHAALHAGGSLGQELAAVALQARSGDWLGAFDAWQKRRPTSEVRALRSAIYIHSVTGGGLSALLGRLAGTVRARLLYEAEVRSRTIEARGSAIILAVAPLFLLVYMAFMQRDNLIYLVTEPIGMVALVYGLVSWLVGLVVVKQLLKVTERAVQPRTKARETSPGQGKRGATR